MNTSPLLLAIRAISVEFARRIFIPTVIIVGIALTAFLAVTIWLVTQSAWWWFLLTPLMIVTFVAIILAVISWYALRFLNPKQTKEQKRTVRLFVDDLQEISEIVQTPKFILLFQLVKDTLFPSQGGLINRVSTHASSTKPSFSAIVASFK